MSTIAVVLADDFEDVEFTEPRDALTDAGHEVVVVGSEPGTVTGKEGTEVEVTTSAADVTAGDYAGLLVPGGFSPDHLRTDDDVVSFVQEMVGIGVPIAAICHAPSLLIEAGVVDGTTMTSFPSIRTDLRNAGAEVVDEELVVDGQFITSRDPDDLPAFCRAFVDALDGGGGDG